MINILTEFCFVLGRYSKVSHGYFFTRHSRVFLASMVSLLKDVQLTNRRYTKQNKGVNKHFSDVHKFIFLVNSQGRKYHLTARETNA